MPRVPDDASIVRNRNLGAHLARHVGVDPHAASAWTARPSDDNDNEVHLTFTVHATIPLTEFNTILNTHTPDPDDTITIRGDHP